MGVQVNETSLKELNKIKRYNQQRQDAAAIAFVALAESGQLDDVTASEQSMLFAEWVPGVAYAVGQLCTAVCRRTPAKLGGSRMRQPLSGRSPVTLLWSGRSGASPLVPMMPTPRMPR